MPMDRQQLELHVMRLYDDVDESLRRWLFKRMIEQVPTEVLESVYLTNHVETKWPETKQIDT